METVCVPTLPRGGIILEIELDSVEFLELVSPPFNLPAPSRRLLLWEYLLEKFECIFYYVVVRFVFFRFVQFMTVGGLLFLRWLQRPLGNVPIAGTGVQSGNRFPSMGII